MRGIDNKFSFWLAGYYDDFNNARVVPDDTNTVGGTYNSINTHHGNPLNGYAPLNPRYNYAWVERGDAVGTTTDPLSNVRFNNAAIIDADDNGQQYLHNSNMSDWLTYDENRRGAQYWEGRAQLQYPDTIANANRQKYDGGTGILGNAYLGTDTADSYIWICNGNDTSGKYWIPIGTNDSSFGRTQIKPFSDISPAGNVPVNGGSTIHTSSVDTAFIQRSHLTGVYMGEKMSTVASEIVAGQGGEVLLYPIKSPAGKPFLCVETYRDMDSEDSYKPVLIYDGNLNCIGDKDIITMRFNMQSYLTGVAGAGTNWMMKFEAGFGSGVTPTSAGYSQTPKIEFEFDSAGNIGKSGGSFSTMSTMSTVPGTIPFAEKLFEEWVNNTQSTYTETQIWRDIDIEIDFSGLTYKIYFDSIEQLSGTLAAGTTASDMYGFEISVRQGTTGSSPSVGSDDNWFSIFCLDRIGTVHPLSPYWNNSTLDAAIYTHPVESFSWDAKANGASSANIVVADDENNIGSSIAPIIQASTHSNWSLLVFRDAPNRPIWRGIVNGVNYKQNAKSSKNDITINATDNSSMLDYQVPNWETGQGGDADSTETISFMRSDTQTKLDTYYFGVERLEPANANLGFDYSADSDAYIPHMDTRMRRASAHPIQVYNNESKGGPNNLEDEWGSKPLSAAFFNTQATPVAGRITMLDVDNVGAGTYYVEDTNQVAKGTYVLSAGTASYGKDAQINVLTFDSLTSAGDLATSDLITFVGPMTGSWTPTANLLNGQNPGTVAMNLVHVSKGCKCTGQGNCIANAENLHYWSRYLYKFTFYFSADHNKQVGDTILINGVGGASTTYDAVVNDFHEVLEVLGDRRLVVGIPSYYSLNTPTWTTGTISSGYPTTVFVDDVSVFPTGGGQCTVGGITFNYDSIDTTNNSLVGCDTFSGTLPQAGSVTYTTGNLTTLAAQDPTNKWVTTIPKGSYISINAMVPGSSGVNVDGIYQVMQTPTWDAGTGNTTLKISALFADTNPAPPCSITQGTYISTYINPGGAWDFDYRSAHARWIRDLPKSKWFRHMFSRIHKDALSESTLSANIAANATSITLNNTGPVSAIEDYDSYSFEIIDADGRSDAGVASGHTGSTTQSILAWWIGTNPSPGDPLRVAFNSTASSALSNGDSVVIEGCKVSDYNGQYTLTESATIVSSLKTFRLRRSDDSILTVSPNGKSIDDFQSDSGTMQFGNVHYGTLTLNLTTPNMLSRSHLSGATLKMRRHTNDYKHVWVLWGDMRNDGNADADGSSRKNDFGLLYPTASNYSITLQWADQAIDAYEGRNAWVDLKIGEDVNLWSMDAQSDPITGDSWSSITDGSDTDENPDLRNWDTKAGAFTIIDASAFFNLNTESNGGNTGQISGGNMELGDFLIETEGFPVIIDNYWTQACANPFNSDGSLIKTKDGWSNFVSDATPVSTNITTDTEWLQLDDVSKWPSSGEGKLVSQENKQVYVYAWSSKGMSYSLDRTTLGGGKGYSQDTSDNSIVFLATGTGSSPPGPLQAGMRVTLTGTGLTGVDGEKIILETNIDDVFGTFKVDGPSTTFSAGLGVSTVSDTNSLYIGDRILMQPPAPDPTTCQIAFWNGLSYMNDDSLTVSGWTLERFLYGGSYAIMEESVDSADTTIPIRMVGQGEMENRVGVIVNDVSRDAITWAAETTTALTTVAGLGKNHEAGSLIFEYNKSGSQSNIIVQDSEDEAVTVISDLTAYNTLANIFPMRMLMQMDGFVRSGNSGTLYESDKVRTLWNDVLSSTWLNQSQLTSMVDINSVPLSNNMTTSQQSIVNAGRGGYITGASESSGTYSITSASHGLAVGDGITIAHTTALDGSFTVAAITNANVFTITTTAGLSTTITGGIWWTTNELDDFGSINDARSSTIMGAISSSKDGSGTGLTNGQIAT